MAHSRIDPRLRGYARLNRIASTNGEKEMWKYLQSFKPYGARFRRQAPIGRYIADFAWLAGRIVIEVDGYTHDTVSAQARDRAKDAFLKSQGFVVLRIRDDDVIANSMGAFSSIERAIYERLPSPPPAPPHKGEGSVGQR
jgi:very-short-patch-repair endonuclease